MEESEYLYIEVRGGAPRVFRREKSQRKKKKCGSGSFITGRKGVKSSNGPQKVSNVGRGRRAEEDLSPVIGDRTSKRKITKREI